MRWFAGFLLYGGVSLIIAFIICERFLPDELFLPGVSEQSATGRFGRFDRFDRRPVAPADRSDSSLSPKPLPPSPVPPRAISTDPATTPDPTPHPVTPPFPRRSWRAPRAPPPPSLASSQLCTAGDCVKTRELWVLLVYALFLAWGGLALAPLGVSTLVWLACGGRERRRNDWEPSPLVWFDWTTESGLGGVTHEPKRNGCCNGRERRGEPGETTERDERRSSEDGDANDEWCVYFLFSYGQLE